MGDLVQFPGFDEREWLAMETTLIDQLTALGIPGDQAEWIRSEWKQRMLTAMQSLRRSVQVTTPAAQTPEAIEFATAAVKETERQFHLIIENLARQLLFAVIELSGAHFGGPPPAKMKAQILELIPGGKNAPPEG